MGSNHRPRIKRMRGDLAPMQMVAGDVRHCDILILREDGSEATPKLVAFMDLATNRLFAHLFIVPKGEMIRREHVLGTMRAMFADPSWGVPIQFYFDNGGEFRQELQRTIFAQSPSSCAIQLRSKWKFLMLRY